jgi:hypothetical protein
MLRPDGADAEFLDGRPSHWVTAECELKSRMRGVFTLMAEDSRL